MSYHKSLQGAGWLSVVPGGTYPDPVHLAEIDGFDIDISEEEEDLEDDVGDVIDSFTKKRSVSGSVSLKDFANSLLAIATSGVTVSAGRKIGYSQAATIPGTPFQITVTNGATFNKDLGVINLTTGKAMTCAATATGTGVYAVNETTGQYTFHTDDAGDSILINYNATQAADGTSAIIAAGSNTGAKYGLYFHGGVDKKHGIYVPQARIPGISAKFAKGAFVSSTLKWKATKDATGNYFHSWLPE